MLLKGHGIHKIYKNDTKTLHVLKGIDIEIAQGELVSIFGHSGAGKSTLLHILGGLDAPTHGDVFLRGESVYKCSAPDRAKVRNEKIGFVFQFYHLLSEFTALENVMLPAMIKGQGALTDKAEGLLQKVGLGKRLDHKPAQLSGGEQQRVAIARALMNDPEVVLCDEPTGNLDSKTGEGIIEFLCNINADEGRTFVIVTHEEDIAKKSSRILRMRDGLWEAA